MTDVMDMFRRTWLFGLGAIAFTTDKAQEFVNELIERGEVSRDQGQSMVNELVKRGNEAREELREMIKSQVKEAIDEVGIPSKSDIQRLEDKIDRLILMQKQSHVSTTEAGEASPEIF